MPITFMRFSRASSASRVRNAEGSPPAAVHCISCSSPALARISRTISSSLARISPVSRTRSVAARLPSLEIERHLPSS